MGPFGIQRLFLENDREWMGTRSLDPGTSPAAETAGGTVVRGEAGLQALREANGIF